jgi:hypothetical protein
MRPVPWNPLWIFDSKSILLRKALSIKLQGRTEKWLLLGERELTLPCVEVLNRRDVLDAALQCSYGYIIVIG